MCGGVIICLCPSLPPFPKGQGPGYDVPPVLPLKRPVPKALCSKGLKSIRNQVGKIGLFFQNIEVIE